MLKAATYARYSTDMQSERSIEDQLRICHKFAAKEGIAIVAGFEDKAITGAATYRPGYQNMLLAARRQEFNVLLVDDLSRLGRSGTETGKTREEFEFLQIRIIAITDGIDSAQKSSNLQFGVKGLFNEIFLDGVREQTHRCLVGKATRGKVAGGRIYGYSNVPVEHPTQKDAYGRAKIVDVDRQINKEQACIVREIFTMYGHGNFSMDHIAHELNRRGIDSPHKRKWAHTGIREMLLNEIYIGRYIWNRTRKLKNKETGARKYIPRPREEWIIKDMQELRIISDDLWQAVREKFALRSHKNDELRKDGRQGNWAANPKYVFSGLLKCGECGGNYTLINNTMYGCAWHKSKGDAVCRNNIRVPRLTAENRLLSSIKDELLNDKVFAAFKKRVIEISRTQPETIDIQPLKQKVKQLDAEIGRLVQAIKNGMMSAAVQKALQECEKQKEIAIRELRSAEKPKRENVLNYIPAMQENYEKMVNHLSDVLNKDTKNTQKLVKQLVGDSIILSRKDDHLEAKIRSGLPMVLQQALVSNGRMVWCPGGDSSASYITVSLKYREST